jgi:hypothetical protein
MCGMKKLSDEIAFGIPGRTSLNARWSRDPASPDFLSPGAQEIRFVGNPAHLAVMKRLGNAAKVVSVHGVDDASCPFSDAEELVQNFREAGLDFVSEWITRDRVDGGIFTSAGHALGDRNRIPGHVAGRWLRPDGPEALERKGPSDFERRDTVRYPTTDGVYVVDYSAGYPVGRFERAGPPATAVGSRP